MRTYKVKVKVNGSPACILNVLASHVCDAIKIAIEHYSTGQTGRIAVVAMPA